jgi:mRNA interferase MazF
MADAEYLPDRGHLVWLDFDPRVGTEQSGHRPALVLSPAAYNRIGQMICCPLTSQKKNWAFLVPISGGERISYAIADQIRCVDWQARGARFIRRVDSAEMGRVRTLARGLI